MNETGKVLGYVAVTRIRLDQIKIPAIVSPNLPPYDYDLSVWHDDKGEIWYIVNHTVLQSGAPKGISRFLLNELKERAFTEGRKGIAVIWNHQHPYLKDRELAQKFWGDTHF